MIHLRRLLIAAIAFAVFAFAEFEFRTSAQKPKPAAINTQMPDDTPSEMRPIIEGYIADRGSLQRSFFVNNSPARRERLGRFYSDALGRIQKLNFDAMSQEGRVDYVLFRSHLEHELRQLDIEAKQQAEIEPLIPFGKTIVALEEQRRNMESMDPKKAAAAAV